MSRAEPVDVLNEATISCFYTVSVLTHVGMKSEVGLPRLLDAGLHCSLLGHDGGELIDGCTSSCATLGVVVLELAHGVPELEGGSFVYGSDGRILQLIPRRAFFVQELEGFCCLLGSYLEGDRADYLVGVPFGVNDACTGPGLLPTLLLAAFASAEGLLATIRGELAEVGIPDSAIVPHVGGTITVGACGSSRAEGSRLS